MKILALRIVAVLALAAASACSPTATACSVVAPPINFAPPQLLYPIPGASGVPDNAKNLVIAVTSQVSLAGKLALVAPGVNIPLTTGGGIPSPAPSPMATVPPGGQAFAVGLPSMNANTTYSVTYVLHATLDPCAPTNTTNNLGSFTTK